MEPPVLFQPFDGGDRLAYDRGGRRQAGTRRTPVNQHGASAALAFAAAVFRASQIQIVAQHAEQHALAVNFDAAFGSVDLKFYSSHSSLLSNLSDKLQFVVATGARPLRGQRQTEVCRTSRAE